MPAAPITSRFAPAICVAIPGAISTPHPFQKSAPRWLLPHKFTTREFSRFFTVTGDPNFCPEVHQDRPNNEKHISAPPPASWPCPCGSDAAHHGSRREKCPRTQLAGSGSANRGRDLPLQSLK